MDDSQLQTKQKQNKPEVQAALGLGHEDSLRPQTTFYPDHGWRRTERQGTRAPAIRPCGEHSELKP